MQTFPRDNGRFEALFKIQREMMNLTAVPSSPQAATTAHLRESLQPHRFRQVLIVLVSAITLGLGIAVLRRNWVESLFLLSSLAALGLALRFQKQGKLEKATAIMLATLTIAVSGLISVSEGMFDEAVLAYPGILVFAGMFSTRRVFITLLVTVALVLTAVTAGGLAGWQVAPVLTPGWGRLANVLSILVATAFFVFLMSRDLHGAMKQLAADNERILDSHARIEVLAHRDSLTNLPNRTLAKDRLLQILSSAKRHEKRSAVMFLDLDNFKTVNDSLGHSAGDQLLCQVADRLVNTVRESDTVSRLGGDEFLILLGEVEDEADATTAVNKILKQLATPFKINGLAVQATASLGVAMFPEDGTDADTLLKNADVAMYKAKDSGRNAFRFFDPEMNSSVVEHLHLSAGIRTALLNDEFRVHYQPQFSLATGKVVGAEALIRWKHPSLGFIPPSKFIPVAERSGLINDVGQWVLSEVCRQTKAWQDSGLRDLVLAVNVSPVQFQRDNIEREVNNALSSCGLNPSCLELELTESLLIADSNHISGVLANLRAIGVKFAIDDFGTGYSNLGYLKSFAVERLKIDQSFVKDIAHNAHNEGIVRAIIEMAHCLQLEVVAEGIEDTETLQRLTELGCEFGQGYLWSPALPADEFVTFVNSVK